MTTPILLRSLKACPECDSLAVFCCSSLDAVSKYSVLCHDCGYEGEEARSTQAAIDLWNHPKAHAPIKRYKDY